MWCGVVSTCAITEGDNVTIGCYAQYDWVATTRQQLISPRFASSLEFLEYPNSYVALRPDVRRPNGTSAPEILLTTYTINSVQSGSDITAECRISFLFNESRSVINTTAYANNSLQHTCRISHAVDCEYSFDICCIEKVGVVVVGVKDSFLPVGLSYLLEVNSNKTIMIHKTIFFTAVIYGAKP